jgi:hypothetical protein
MRYCLFLGYYKEKEINGSFYTDLQAWMSTTNLQ